MDALKIYYRNLLGSFQLQMITDKKITVILCMTFLNRLIIYTQHNSSV